MLKNSGLVYEKYKKKSMNDNRDITFSGIHKHLYNKIQ